MASRGPALVVAVVCLVLCAGAPRADAPPAGGGRLFDENDLITLELQAPFAELVRVRSGPSSYLPARLRYLEHDGREVLLPVEVRSRGKTRRRRDICAFPPIRMRFSADTTGTLFEGQKALKLVTHCQDRQSYDQYVVLEYLAYRAYNQLTERGHRVRLARISYVDTTRNARRRTHYGIFLEDWKAVGRRNNLEPIDVDGAVNINKLSVSDANRVAVFQYMIGNQDWSVLWPEPDSLCCHNTKPLLAPDDTVVPLPYDFDYAGIVGTPYARGKHGGKNVRLRRYGGLCATQAQLSETVALFSARREAIYALFRDQAELNSLKRTSALRYLDGFYRVLDDPEQVDARLVRRCQEE